MKLQERIENDLRAAMTAKDETLVSVLRLLKNAFHNQFIAKKKELTEEEVVEVLSSQSKQRRDSIEAYTQGGRDDLAEKEKKELKIIKKYLPEQLSEDEVKKVVQGVIDTLEGADKNFGSVMGHAMGKLKGHVDGKEVARIVNELVA